MAVAPAPQGETKALSPKENVLKTLSELDNYRHILAEAKDHSGRISDNCLGGLQEMADQITAKREKISPKIRIGILHVHTAITHEKKGNPEMAAQRWNDAHRKLQCDDEVCQAINEIRTLNEGMLTRLAVGIHVAELGEQAERKHAEKNREEKLAAKQAKPKEKKAKHRTRKKD